MTLLNFADEQPSEFCSVLLYGPSGVGKSVAAASAPDPIIYCNADGPGALRYARRHHKGKQIMEVPVAGRAPIDALIVELRNGDWDDVKTVALDSLGRIYDVLLAELAGPNNKPSLPQRGDVNTMMERCILSLLELPVNLVLVAHDNPVVVTGKEEDGTAEVELFPHTGTNNPGLAKKIMRPLDIVAFCGRRMVGEGEEKHEEFLAQTYNAGGRHGKDRTDVVGANARLDLTEWFERIHAAYPTQTPQEVAA